MLPLVFAGTAMVFVMGCGTSEFSEVTGTIRFKGELVPDGGITFVSANGTGPTAGGMIKEGKYTASNVPHGMSKVRITSSKITGMRKAYDTPDSPTIPIEKELLPSKYNNATELTYDVKPGSNQKDWDLTK